MPQHAHAEAMVLKCITVCGHLRGDGRRSSTVEDEISDTEDDVDEIVFDENVLSDCSTTVVVKVIEKFSGPLTLSSAKCFSNPLK